MSVLLVLKFQFPEELNPQLFSLYLRQSPAVEDKTWHKLQVSASRGSFPVRTLLWHQFSLSALGKSLEQHVRMYHATINPGLG